MNNAGAHARKAMQEIKNAQEFVGWGLGGMEEMERQVLKPVQSAIDDATKSLRDEIHDLNNKLCSEQLNRERAETFIKSCQGAPCTCTVDCDVALKHDKEQWCPTCAINDFCKKLEANDV